jgi:hypothetical protein
MFVGAISKVRRKSHRDRLLRRGEIEVSDAESRTSRPDAASCLPIKLVGPQACSRRTCRLGTCVQSAAL